MFQKLTLISAIKNGEKIADVCNILKISEPIGFRRIDN
jgi:hypothetical protein